MQWGAGTQRLPPLLPLAAADEVVVIRFWRRSLVVATVIAVGAAFHAVPAQAAGPGFIVGADEDAFVWGNSQLNGSIARTLGLKAVRITLQWRPGQSEVPANQQEMLDRLVLDASGLRVVVSVYGAATDAPRTDDARAQYCGFVGDLLKRYRQINDVVIWNDPNDSTFWSPQFAPGGESTAPGDYGALLAQCWDTAHAVRGDANVISLSVSKVPAAPGSFTLGYHAPGTWIAKLAESYKASGRAKPIFDTFGYIPHAVGSSERPWTKHTTGSTISVGDYEPLMQALRGGFQGSAQPVPGEGSTRIWYLAQGYQTAPDPEKAGLYSGSDADPAPVPAWSPQEAADAGVGPGVDQPMQLADAIKVAYCQPAVGAYFNFHLFDESELGGWQSGVFWADGSPKPGYQALRRAAGEANSGAINCASFSPAGMPPRPTPVQPIGNPLAITNLHATSAATYGATLGWQTSVPATVQVAYGLADFGVPTTWATAGENGASVSLAGLDAGTSYRVWVRAISDDGQRAQTSIELTTRGLPAHPSVGVNKAMSAVTVDGQPYFPMILYSVCPWQYGPALSVGINLFSLNACGTLQTQLNALGGAAYSAGVAGGHGGSGPGLIGWFHYDEPDGANVSAAELPGGPPGIGGLSFLTLTNHFYSGAAPLTWGRGMYPGLIAKADVVGFDLYPLQEWCRPHRMADVYYSQRELVKLSGDKPTFQWIEAADWKCPGGQTAVTPAVVRAESWMAIAGGAHGLGFWPASWPAGNARAIAAVGREVARLGPAVYRPDEPVSDDNSQILVSARTWGGALYVIAVNSGYSAAQTTFKVPALNGRTLTVMGESRRLATAADSFTDSFAPLAVHIYIASPATT
jgi:hypothetical protein